jgi:hypothetical protein
MLEVRVLQIGGTQWVQLRARGADWSYLTPAECLALARQWLEEFGDDATGESGRPNEK